MSKKKYYVVWQGVEPGIYESWSDCQLQIKGYPGAQYASFKTIEAAREAYDNGYHDHISGKATKVKNSGSKANWGEDVDLTAWAVDAACSGNPGVMEYRGVHVSDAGEIFRMGPFKLGTNNIGEFLALVHAAALLKNSGDSERLIYTDSRTALSWIKKKKVKTTLSRNKNTQVLFDLIERAEKWLHNNDITNPIIKWDTDNWGEIPADFGRK